VVVEIEHTSEDEAEEVWENYLVRPGAYDRPMDARGWEDLCLYYKNPGALAFDFLDRLDLGPALKASRQSSYIAFHEGSCPGTDSKLVTASDHLAISMLQARLIDLKLPIAVVQGEPIF
jgi:hypothetical protein